ncbi:MAG: glycerol-3-phosphate 1-O-acyltransferase PlsY [Prochlorococcus sp.]|jgi:glycerol-3-phosphate acyltransferase PlsY|nr:glycerol-3-phosphate 1-O-acyltransferase PlsY [Prochlorococcus sp.]MDP6193596.1 glycerol-3-phosphate 1-O-acyltransferase PlsY [Prochlorococcaceae cyanobacterium ETNP18_MAG_1]
MTPDSFLPGLFSLLLAYLLGAIPTGYLISRWVADLDIRDVGSGSTGATNVLRQVGKGPALVVFLVDVAKGTTAVVLARSLQLGDEWQVLAGLAALAGHIWPVWLGWKGGKAVATGLGMLLGLSWPVGLACFGVFVTVISFSRIVSLASVSAAISLPLLMLWSFVGSSFRPAYLVLALIAMVLVVWRHRSNLKRLLAGSEPKLGQPR